MSGHEHDGWLGATSALFAHLEKAHADKDEDGRFHVTGHISSFLGMTGPEVDVCVGANAKYFVGGAPVALAPQLRSSNEGLGITIITSLI